MRSFVAGQLQVGDAEELQVALCIFLFLGEEKREKREIKKTQF